MFLLLWEIIALTEADIFRKHASIQDWCWITDGRKVDVQSWDDQKYYELHTHFAVNMPIVSKLRFFGYI